MASESTAEHQGQLALIGPAVKLGGGPGIGVRQGDEQLKVKLNKTIGTVHIDGSLKALTTKYSRSHTYTLQMMTRQNLTVEPEAHMQNESICRDLELRNRVVDFITQPDSTLKRPPQTPALLATSTY